MAKSFISKATAADYKRYPAMNTANARLQAPMNAKPMMSPMATPNWAKGIKTPTALPSYKKGGMVKKTGPALVHKGELVIPKKHAAQLAEFLSKKHS